MRKDIKNKILDIVKTIFSAHNDIEKLLKKNIVESAASLIGDCQDAIIYVGEIIQNSEGETHNAVELIEIYCRELFDLYNALKDGDEYDASCKKINKSLTDVKKCIENDIRGKIEVVFMPYKASMWDSLESVWKAADEDPDCDAYVVPIPYYDRKPDKSLGAFHYEGDQYPEYVPVVHYDNYDLKKRKPDIIYIHNPYDECNYVTTVDPGFYSKELKKYTDKLIYIPYFVLNENLSNIEHFVLTPGVLNADEIIVQSEKIKQMYINILLKYTGNSEQNRNFLNNKIKGTGSPKFDKIKNMSFEDVVVPEEWKKIIYRPDGTRKKVIMYNNSVGSLLKYERKMLEKMCSVFNTFIEKRDDVVLLWRPHPLIKATLESMRPDLLEAYTRMVEQYRNDGWGIYDDSADLDRAIAISDAYYGDESSVVELCKRMKLPIMIQNVYIDN